MCIPVYDLDFPMYEVLKSFQFLHTMDYEVSEMPLVLTRWCLWTASVLQGIVHAIKVKKGFIWKLVHVVLVFVQCSQPEVVTKYKGAAEICNLALAHLVEEAKVGMKVIDLCTKSDEFLTQ